LPSARVDGAPSSGSLMRSSERRAVGRVTPRAATARQSVVVWTWAVIASGLLLVLFDQRLKRRAFERDVLAGVLARFGDLAVTGTELLVGDALTPYPLTGMRARVGDCGNGIAYLYVEGPTVGLVRKVVYRRRPKALVAMREWVQTLNRQAHDNPEHGMSA